MGSHGKRFLHDLPTLKTLLAGETGVHSNDLMSGAFSLGSENVEERATTGIQDGFRQRVQLHHSEDYQILYHNAMILFGVRFGGFEMEIAALPFDFEMSLGGTPSGLPVSLAALLATAHHALLAPERSLACAVIARVLDRVSFRVRQEGLESYVKANIRMLTLRGKMGSRRSGWTGME